MRPRDVVLLKKSQFCDVFALKAAVLTQVQVETFSIISPSSFIISRSKLEQFKRKADSRSFQEEFLSRLQVFKVTFISFVISHLVTMSN